MKETLIETDVPKEFLLRYAALVENKTVNDTVVRLVNFMNELNYKDEEALFVLVSAKQTGYDRLNYLIHQGEVKGTLLRTQACASATPGWLYVMKLSDFYKIQNMVHKVKIYECKTVADQAKGIGLRMRYR
jgi:hypothetical protein